LFGTPTSSNRVPGTLKSLQRLAAHLDTHYLYIVCFALLLLTDNKTEQAISTLEYTHDRKQGLLQQSSLAIDLNDLFFVNQENRNQNGISANPLCFSVAFLEPKEIKGLGLGLFFRQAGRFGV
jgi:hypothetical protein